MSFIVGEHGYSYHMILREEQRSFSNWINSNLGDMAELKHLLPLKNDGDDLYDKIADGILLWWVFPAQANLDTRTSTVLQLMS